MASKSIVERWKEEAREYARGARANQWKLGGVLSRIQKEDLADWTKFLAELSISRKEAMILIRLSSAFSSEEYMRWGRRKLLVVNQGGKFRKALYIRMEKGDSASKLEKYARELKVGANPDYGNSRRWIPRISRIWPRIERMTEADQLVILARLEVKFGAVRRRLRKAA